MPTRCTRATVSSGLYDGPALARSRLDERAARARYPRRPLVVSVDFVALRVVVMMVRCDDRDRSARKSSTRRWQIPRPMPLVGNVHGQLHAYIMGLVTAPVFQGRRRTCWPR